MLDTDVLIVDEEIFLAVEAFAELSWAGMLDAAAVRFGSVLM